MQGYEVLFCETQTPTLGLENLGLQTPTPNSSSEKPGVQLRLWDQNQTPTLNLGLDV